MRRCRKAKSNGSSPNTGFAPPGEGVGWAEIEGKRAKLDRNKDVREHGAGEMPA